MFHIRRRYHFQYIWWLFVVVFWISGIQILDCNGKCERESSHKSLPTVAPFVFCLHSCFSHRTWFALGWFLFPLITTLYISNKLHFTQWQVLFLCLLTCYRFLVPIQAFTPKASLQRKHLSFNQSVNDVFCFFVCTGAGMSATKGSPAKSGWSGGGMLEIRKWFNLIWYPGKWYTTTFEQSENINDHIWHPHLT